MIAVNIVGVALIALIVWWFWIYKPKEVSAKEKDITVLVENGVYQPSRITLAANQTVSIHFLRKDASSCAATIVFPDLGISEELPLDKRKTIVLPAMEEGEYAFSCQMQMYRGVLLVE